MRQYCVRNGVRLLAFLILPSLAGCVTQLLKDSTSSRTYHELISTVLLQPEKRLLVAGTNKYHYIFDLPGELETSLLSGTHDHLIASFDTFNLHEDLCIEGDVQLILPAKFAGTYTKSTLAPTGLKLNKFGEYTAKFHLKGTRYDAGAVNLSIPKLKLNRSYTVDIHEPVTIGKSIAKTLLTPITISVDGVAAIAATPFVVASILNCPDTSGFGCD